MHNFRMVWWGRQCFYWNQEQLEGLVGWMWVLVVVWAVTVLLEVIYLDRRGKR